MKSYSKELEGKVVRVEISNGNYKGTFHNFESLYTKVWVNGEPCVGKVHNLEEVINNYYKECIQNYRDFEMSK